MHQPGERGFVLISAMWLLMLAGSIAALLMLRGLTDARSLKEEAQSGRSLARDDEAIAQVVADLLIGGASGLGQLPATGEIVSDGDRIQVTLSSEQLRLDPNKATMAEIDGKLHDAGYLSKQRAAILSRIAASKSGNHLINSFAAIAMLNNGVVAAGSEACLNRQLSPFGGTEVNQSILDTPHIIHLGDVVRIQLQDGSRRVTYVLRVTGQLGDTYGILDWYDDHCPKEQAA